MDGSSIDGSAADWRALGRPGRRACRELRVAVKLVRLSDGIEPIATVNLLR